MGVYMGVTVLRLQAKHWQSFWQAVVYRIPIPRPLRWRHHGVGWVEASPTVAVISPEQIPLGQSEEPSYSSTSCG